MVLSDIVINPFLAPNSKIKNQKYYQPVKILLKRADYYTVRGNLNKNKALLSFEKCNFKHEISFEIDGDFPLSLLLHFSGCILDSMDMSTMVSKRINLFFFSCYVKRLHGKNPSFTKITIQNCIGSFFFNGFKNVSVSYTKENIFPKVWSEITTMHNDLTKIKTTYHVDNVENFNFYSNILEDAPKKSYIERKRDEPLNDYKIRFIPSIDFIKSISTSLTIDYGEDNTVNEFSITSSCLKSLILRGKLTGKLKVEDSIIDNIYIHNFTADQNFRLFQVKSYAQKSGNFEIHKSFLDETWFYGVRFDSYNIVSFYRSNLANTKFTSTVFQSKGLDYEVFKSLKNVHYPNEKNDSYQRDQYELFLQLKMALLKTGNTFESQRMQGIAFNSLEKVNHLNFEDRIILKLNRWTNMHGTQPRNALWLFLGTSIFFYIIYLETLGLHININNDFDWKLIGHYFSFINIAHKLNFLVEKNSLTAASMIIDFFNRILGGYLIYQFISAFRKFGKK